MAIKNRVIFWSVLVALLVAALTFSFWPRAVPVDMVAVTQGPMSVTIDEEGETRLKDIFTVHAPVSGKLDRIILEPGDRVISGQTQLAVIRPSMAPTLDQRTQAQLLAAIQSAQSAIAMSEFDISRLTAVYNLAQKTYDRQAALYARNYASRAAFEQAETGQAQALSALQSAQSALKMRRADLQMARSALMPRQKIKQDKPNNQPSNLTSETLFLTAVIDGVVLHIDRESEGPVASGAALMEIGNSDDIEIVVDLLSEDAVRVSQGDSVVISGWGGEPLAGHVRLIEPFAFTKVSALGIEEQRVNVIINFDEPIPPQLGHGYRVDIAVVIWNESRVLRVPLTALFKQGNAWQAYSVRAGRAELKTLEIGEMNGQFAQVIEGLARDDRVIEHPSGRIESGRRVTNRNDQ